MNKSKSHQGAASLSDFIRDLSVELESKDLEETRLRVLAFEKVDEVLLTISQEQGFQVYRGGDIVEEYRISRQNDVEPISIPMLDYLIRKGNVEFQLEVNLLPEGGCYIDEQSLDRYHSILANNSKSEEVILVWDPEDLPSITLGLDDVRKFLSEVRKSGEGITISDTLIRPLRQTIKSAFENHRQIILKPTDIHDMRRIDFDLNEAFSNRLEENLDKLRESVQRRRSPERILAISSISKSDEQLIRAIFSDAKEREMDSEKLKSRIDSIGEGIHLEDDD